MSIMEQNGKFWTIVGAIITLLSFIIGVGLTVYFNRDKSTIIEIRKMSCLELTKPLDVDRLSSTYLYDDSIPVEHLWQSSYILKNIGDKTIYGAGYEPKSIRNNAVKLHIDKCNLLLALEILDTNTDGCLQDDSLVFYQWRPEEYIELQILSDGPDAPRVQISDRDIKDVRIVNTEYSPEEKLTPSRFVDRLPRTLSRALWWIVIVFEFILLFVLLVAGGKQIRQTTDRITKISTVIVWVVMLFLLFAPLLWMF